MRRRSPTASGRAGGRGFWTEQRIEELRRLWADGLVGTAIAERLGTTKDAVVSKAHRLELDSRQPDSATERGPSRLERRLAALASATGISVEALLGLQRCHRPQPRGTTLFASCQFVVGDLRAGGHRCGAPVVRNTDGWPYCAEHLERCRAPRRPVRPGQERHPPEQEGGPPRVRAA